MATRDDVQACNLEDEADAILVRARMLTTSGETVPFADVLRMLDEEPDGWFLDG